MGGCGKYRYSTPCLLLGALLIGGPDLAGQGISWGPRVGLNLSGVIFEDTPAADAMALRWGGHLGLASSLAVNRYVRVEASILLSQDGFRGRGAYPGDLRLHYLDLPVVIKLALPRRIAPHLVGGLSVGREIGCSLSGVALVGETTCDDPLVGSRWRDFDVGAVFGVGASLATGLGRWEVDALAGLGVRDLKADPLPPGTAKRAWIRLSAVLLRGGGEGS